MKRQLLKDYLTSARLVQIATASDGRPWVCTVYFVVDNELNLYWLSYPARRHSQEIEQNSQVAAAVVVKADQPVVGVQLEGRVSVVSEGEVVKEVMGHYIRKYDAGKDFYNHFIHGTNKHHLYKCTPNKVYLFDEVNFPEGERSEVFI